MTQPRLLTLGATGAEQTDPGQLRLRVTLTAGQELQEQSIQIPSNYAFELMAISQISTGNFEAQRKSPTLQLVSNAPLQRDNFAGTAATPVVVFPSQVYPAGSNLTFATIKDLSGATNAIEIVLHGVKHFA